MIFQTWLFVDIFILYYPCIWFSLMITVSSLSSASLISEQFFISYDLSFLKDFIITPSLSSPAVHTYCISKVSWLCTIKQLPIGYVYSVLVVVLRPCPYLFYFLFCFCCHHYQFLLFNNITLFVVCYIVVLCWHLWIQLVEIRSLYIYKLLTNVGRLLLLRSWFG